MTRLNRQVGSVLKGEGESMSELTLSRPVSRQGLSGESMGEWTMDRQGKSMGANGKSYNQSIDRLRVLSWAKMSRWAKSVRRES